MDAQAHENLFDPQLEKRVIASLFVCGWPEPVRQAVESLDVDCFMDSMSKAVFPAIRTYIRQIPEGEPVDGVEMRDHIARAIKMTPDEVGGWVMHTLGRHEFWSGWPSFQQAHATQIPRLAKRLRLLANRRNAAQQAFHILNDVQDGKMDITAAADALAEAASSMDVAASDELPVTWMDQIKDDGKPLEWLWDGYILRGEATLIHGAAKAGKTTLLAHILRAAENGGAVGGLEVKKSRILVVSEESIQTWAKRKLAIELGSNVAVLPREDVPWAGRPTWAAWERFAIQAAAAVHSMRLDMIVIDTLTKHFPGDSENDNTQMQRCLDELRRINTAGAALLVMHHLGKDHARGGRGASSMDGWAEVVISFRKKDGNQRELVAISRYDDTPERHIIELTLKNEYVSCDHLSGRSQQMYEIAKMIGEGARSSVSGIMARIADGDWDESRSGPPLKIGRINDLLREGLLSGVFDHTGSGRPRDPWLWGEVATQIDPTLYEGD